MLLGCVKDRDLLGLLDIDTKPESLLVEVLTFSTELESDSFCGVTGLTPSKDLRTVEDCSGSGSELVSVIFFGVEVVLEVIKSDIMCFLSEIMNN